MNGVKLTIRLILLLVLTLGLTMAPAASWAASGSAAAGQNVAAAGHGDGHGAAHGDSLSKEKLTDLFWRVVNFIVLMIILVKFAAKPIGNALSSRRQQVKEEIEGLEARRAEAEKSFQDFSARLAAIETDISGIVERAVAQAEIEKSRIIEKAEQTAADIKRQAELAIQKEIMEAKRSLKDEVAEKAATMAQTLIVNNLTQADQVKIIEDYLTKVGAAQ